MQNCQRRYLLIEDDPGDIEILRRLLDDISAGEAEVTTFADAESALSALSSIRFDLIFVDYLLGEQTGLDALESIRDRGCECPVVFLTGQGSEEVAVEAMKAGVSDYLVKGNLSANMLHRTVVNVLARFELEQKVKEQQRQLAEKVRELQDALDHVKTLQGILPICMHCQKIRDDKGTWDQLADYVSQHSDVNFSHGVCPACMEKHYPGMVESDDTA